MTFDEEAPGICAVTAQYPGEAPAAIEYLGETYVQSTKGGVPRTPPGTVVATSDGWTVRSLAGRALYLLTGDAMYTYRVTSGC